VAKRRYARIAVIGTALVCCCLLLSFWIASRAHEAAASRNVSSVMLVPHRTRTTLAVATPLAACETRLERESRRVPTVAIVGASYTAGVGPDNPELSWAVRLAEDLHWNAVVYGVPGAGYVRRGDGERGPMARMLRQEDLRGLHPALVIIQAGHDDDGVPAALERARVRATVDLIESQTPGAQIALLTTFADSADGTPALRETDRAIVTAGIAADNGIIVIDPLARHWVYAHAHGGLHPTAAGDAWIARSVEAVLDAHGLRPAAVTGNEPVICDQAVSEKIPPAKTD
jgi:lysophospholipase L1-like esterase